MAPLPSQTIRLALAHSMRAFEPEPNQRYHPASAGSAQFPSPTPPPSWNYLGTRPGQLPTAPTPPTKSSASTKSSANPKLHTPSTRVVIPRAKQSQDCLNNFFHSHLTSTPRVSFANSSSGTTATRRRAGYQDLATMQVLRIFILCIHAGDTVDKKCEFCGETPTFIHPTPPSCAHLGIRLGIVALFRPQTYPQVGKTCLCMKWRNCSY